MKPERSAYFFAGFRGGGASMLLTEGNGRKFASSKRHHVRKMAPFHSHAGLTGGVIWSPGQGPLCRYYLLEAAP